MVAMSSFPHGCLQSTHKVNVLSSVGEQREMARKRCRACVCTHLDLADVGVTVGGSRVLLEHNHVLPGDDIAIAAVEWGDG